MNNKLDSLFISKEKSQIIKSDVVKCHGIFIKPAETNKEKE